jgi:curved DNA-binding protein CbpA
MMAMPGPRQDPYAVLGVSRDASASELRAAYRRLVQLHHPDHNGGSPESARRFEEVQEAYAAVIAARRVAPQAEAPPVAGDPDVEARVADIERQIREAHAARERARRAAREAAAATAQGERPATDEELGYITTDDSFSKVLADALDELATRLKGRD